jgi:hypothetical protein
MNKLTALTCLLIVSMFASINATAQVGSVKSASSSNKSGGSDRGGRSGSFGPGMVYMFADVTIRGLAIWQTNVLERRGEVPNVLSLEIFGQAAIQPSTYYVFTPRIRGNWGIFLTDFRMNYMVEEKIGAPEDLRTDDWQILGLNFINTRNITARLSTGIMHEAFGEGAVFNESVLGISVMNNDQSLGCMTEFRLAKDYSTITIPRFEGSVGVQKKLFDRNATHLFVTGGLVFQRYYNKVNVWGLQGGFALKLY